ncbi:proteasome subunit alpha type [Striga asiatica]|uniref:Proteasome subunit alpha type n=1 Tax=Striga asiatica TaxID=4170 RepID=A0A5A7R3M2_STRAF|nr:proteasome subunit alpha type [Striga asiatica]
MSSIGTGYDLSVTTFSPDGRVFQIEYAAKAVDNSGTVVGIKCKDGVVMGVEKLIASKMMLPGSNRRIHSVHRHSGMSSVIDLRRMDLVFHCCQSRCLNAVSGYVKLMLVNFRKGCIVWCSKMKAVAGLAADGRQIVARAKSEATNYESVYGEPIPVQELAQRVASYVHLCTLYWWLRPFGCGVILGGYDRDGPQLYMVEPSGISYRYFGAAIGKGRQAAKTEIEKLNLSEMTCRQGVIEVAKIIYGVHDEAKDKAFELEMSWVCDESNRQHQKVPDDLLEEAKTAAKAALEEMDAD